MSTLLTLLGRLRRTPFPADPASDPTPPVQLRLVEENLEVSQRWPSASPLAVSIPLEQTDTLDDSYRRVSAYPATVDAQLLWTILSVISGDNLTLDWPVEPGAPLGIRGDGWHVLLLGEDPDIDLLPTRRRLEQLLREGYGVEDLSRDADGDYRFDVAGTALYVRLARRSAGPPVAQVFAIMAEVAEVDRDLLAELNELNASTSLVKVFTVGQQLLVEAELTAEGIDYDSLGAACNAVTAALRQLGPVLRARFGVLPEPDEPPAPEVPWEAYEATELRVRGPGGWTLCRPAAGSTCDGGWPAVWGARLAVITAYNPMSVTRSEAENDEAQQHLVQDLLESGWWFTQALGSSPDGAWAEPSLAVADAPTDELRLLVRRYGQAAMFVVEPDGITVVGCLSDHTTGPRPWAISSVGESP